MTIYKPPRVQIDSFGRPVITAKQPADFIHLLGLRIDQIIPFDQGSDDLLDQGAIILPRHYVIFPGTIDGVLQYKPYEFNQYRIVVSLYKDIISSIDSIG
jgi:hypothetical protein